MDSQVMKRTVRVTRLMHELGHVEMINVIEELKSARDTIQKLQADNLQQAERIKALEIIEHRELNHLCAISQLEYDVKFLEQQLSEVAEYAGKLRAGFKMIEPAIDFTGWENSKGESIGSELNALMSLPLPKALRAMCVQED